VSEGKLEVLCMKSFWSSATASGMQTAWPGNDARDGYGRDTETEHRVLRIPTTTQQ
jgi:hypothetical protein